MRSAILVILSAIALGGVFVAYWVAQPATPVVAGRGASGDNPGSVPPPPRRREDANNGIHAGDNAWLKQFSNQGEVTSEFRGEQFHPRPNGTIDVVKPVAKFYLANHQRLEVEGEKGNVVVRNVPGPARNGGFSNSSSGETPSHGRLDDVTVRLIDETTGRVVLNMRTNNTVFDKETFKIYTEGYRDEQGRDVAFDQVPVTVTGDVRMKGRGLVVQWNARDGRLELLEIAHGEVLVVDPAMMGGAHKPAKGEAQALGPRWPAAPIPVMLAAKDKKAAGDVITSFRAPATQPKGVRASHPQAAPVVYRAVFSDNVRINQLDPTGTFDQLLIDNVDRMDVDFLMKQSEGGGPSSRPATAPASAPAAEAASAAASQPAAAAGPAAPAAKAPAETNQPVYVRWSGKLVMRPLLATPHVKLNPGDSAVKLVGNPVQIHRVEPRQAGMEDVRSASVLYASAGDNVYLDCSPQFPQILIDKAPEQTARDQRVTHLVSTGQVQYSGGGHLVRLTGAGNAQVPLDTPPGETPAVLHAAWGKLAEIDFSGTDAQGQPVIRAGRFAGDVDIEHPRLNLRSQQLDLRFATTARPPAPGDKSQKPQSQTNLQWALATTGVDCVLIDANGKKQMIDADRLKLETATSGGKLYARHVTADGSVHAFADDDLRADALDVLLKPAARNATAAADGPAARGARGQRAATDDPNNAQVDLEELVATGHVVARSKDASVAMGDRLVVTGAGAGKTHAVITSAVASKVMDAKGNFVTGPDIQFDTGEGRAYIVGPGSLYAVQQSSNPAEPAQPMKVTWATGAQFDGAANRIDADGSINAESTDRRGVVQKAVGDHIRIDLRRKEPPTTPAPAAAAQPVMASASEPGMKAAKGSSMTGNVQMDLFKDKEVVAFHLTGNADMESTLAGADGSVLQQTVVQGPAINVFEFAADGTRSRSMSIPAAGRMLVRDNRAPDAAAADDGQARGTTTFRWNTSLDYVESTNRADMVGKVHIVHMDAPKAGVEAQAGVDMDAERVAALFEPASPKKPAGGAARPAPAAGATTKKSDSGIQLKYVSAFAADGDFVVVRHGSQEMAARQVDYDPRRRVLIAMGSQRNPVKLSNGGTVSALAEQIEWDTITWDPKLINPIVDYRPAQPAVQVPKPKPKPTDPLRPGERSIR